MRLSLIVQPKMPLYRKEEAEKSVYAAGKTELPLQLVTWWWEGTAPYYFRLKKTYQCPNFIFFPSLGKNYLMTTELMGMVWHTVRNLCWVVSFSHRDLLFSERGEVPNYGELHYGRSLLLGSYLFCI